MNAAITGARRNAITNATTITIVTATMTIITDGHAGKEALLPPLFCFAVDASALRLPVGLPPKKARSARR
ncbi:hypothetical protein [Candidatus Pantoea persica]|uniref:hypothetical protein n=1 Tax=Candidatus Pantoea persica TaxID=2518128 RepID=UPI00215D6505|nr:hypothetical protein [Candidatus Pantoea persica]